MQAWHRPQCLQNGSVQTGLRNQLEIGVIDRFAAHRDKVSRAWKVIVLSPTAQEELLFTVKSAVNRTACRRVLKIRLGELIMWNCCGTCKSLTHGRIFHLFEVCSAGHLHCIWCRLVSIQPVFIECWAAQRSCWTHQRLSWTAQRRCRTSQGCAGLLSADTRGPV